LAITPSASDFADANAADGKTTTISYAIANGTKGLAANYSMASLSATGDINPASLIVTATGPAKIYGSALTAGVSTTDFTATGMIEGETVTSVTLTPDAAGLSSTTPAGTSYVVTPSLAAGTNGFIAGNYNISYTDYNGTVAKKVLTVTADSKSKTYDGSVYSPFTSTITGFVNGEKMADVVTGKVTYSGTAITAVNAGTYIITPVITNLSAVNYSFVSANGSLRIYNEEIVDNTPPIWVTAPKALDRTVIYNDADGLTAAQALKPVASDENSFTLTKISGQFEKSSTCDLTGKYTNTWTAKDSYGNTSSVYTQVITIADLPNAKPLIAQVKDFSVYKNSKQVEVALSGIDPTSGCSLQEITSLVGVAENSSLITDVSVTYTKGSSTGTLLLTIADDTEGESIIRVTLKDNGGSENGGSDTNEMTFKVKVVSTDHGPKLLSEIPAQVINPGGKISIDLDDFFSSQDGNSISYTVTLADGSPLPSWMSYDPLTGIISGVAPQNESGSYLVTITVTDNEGLSIKTNFWVVLTSSGTLVISGTVSSSTGYVTSGVQVVLLSVDANNKASVVGTRDLDATSSFAFSSLSSGSYLLKTVVTNAVKYPNLLNTYFNGSSSISTAQKIELASTNKTGVNLVMLPKMFGEGGDGSIAGLVVRKQGPVNEANTETGQIAPGVDVVLKQDGKIVDNTSTNLEGKYIFSSLPTGKYVVEAEQLGYTLNVVKKVTLNADTMVVENVNFILWTLGTIITDVKDLTSGTTINMYPNPTSGQLHIVSNIDNSATVSVSTLAGKEVFRRSYLSGETINIDLSTQTSGLYMVTFESEGKSVTRKIVLRK
jgi:hypothetical protein